MGKEDNTLTSYNQNDIMNYLNVVMNKLAEIENDNGLKNKQLYNCDLEIKRLQQENLELKSQINYYKQIETNLNSSYTMIKTTGEQIRNNALKEKEIIINDAKNMASRILNDALIKSEKIEFEACNLQKKTIIYKNKLRTFIENELELIDDIEKIEF